MLHFDALYIYAMDGAYLQRISHLYFHSFPEPHQDAKPSSVGQKPVNVMHRVDQNKWQADCESEKENKQNTGKQFIFLFMSNLLYHSKC